MCMCASLVDAAYTAPDVPRGPAGKPGKTHFYQSLSRSVTVLHR